MITDDFGMSGSYHEFNFTPVKTNKEIISLLWERDPREMEFARSHGEHLMKETRPGRMHSSAPIALYCELTHGGQTIPWSYGHTVHPMDLDST